MKKHITEYLKWKASYAPSASKSYAVVLKRLSLIEKLETIDDVVEFKNKIAEEYSPTTVNYSMTIIKDFVNYCWYQKYTELSPKLIKPPRFTPKRRAVPTAEEIEKLVNVWDPNKFTELRNRVIILLLRDTGLRLSELVKMKISDIADTLAIIETSKGYREDIVMWSKETNKEFLKYLGTRICISNADNVWCSVANTLKISGRQIERIFNESCKKACIVKKITPHTLRHFKAHYMQEKGANVKEIQVALRHSENNPRAAFQYIRLDNMETKKILKKYI